MQNHVFLILSGVIAIVVLFLSGCGQIKVDGKVTFPDGTPLAKGKVIFENATDEYTGQIHEDGTFSLGALKDGTGIPSGKYKVAVVAVDRQITPKQPPTKPTKPPERPKPTDRNKKPKPPANKPVITHLVAEKFRSTKTSGIEYDIQKNTRDIVIVVEKP
ncbi:MAG: hypothetical protein LBT09_09105 [Planctomycetaceae bacterium]|jgi:hypothetical protein|nr:hypothetical protein [Planctomycetaceae bacterium]